MIKRENDHLGGRESARADRSAARAPLAATGSRTRSLVYVALCIAVMAASAWVAIPIGPVPITLQIFAVVFALQILTPKQLMCALAGYLLLGAIGIPVFSGMRGGFGVHMTASFRSVPHFINSRSMVSKLFSGTNLPPVQ